MPIKYRKMPEKTQEEKPFRGCKVEIPYTKLEN
jgi:hypothetical protein